MSQAGIVNVRGSGTGPVETLSGNDGVLVPPTGGDIQVVGSGVVASGISTAGNIYVTGNAGTSTLTIHETQAQFLTNYNSTNIDFAHSPYTAAATDYFISVDCSAGPVTILLPNAPSNYRLFVVKDRTGSATALNEITITTVGGVVNIDGSPSFFLNDAFEASSFTFNGTSYESF